MTTITITQKQAPPEAIRSLRLFKGKVVHAVGTWADWHTLCAIDLVDRTWVHSPPPVTCEQCLVALGCLAREV
jgi:hypothetical protein